VLNQEPLRYLPYRRNVKNRKTQSELLLLQRLFAIKRGISVDWYNKKC
jgi:hypothetical protein